MAVRFERCFKNEIVEATERFGVKNLILEIQKLQPEEIDKLASAFVFDIHLRENNELMIYYGATCLLVINFSKADQGEVSFKSKSYSGVDGFDTLKNFKNLAHIDIIKENVKHFLFAAVKVAAASKRQFLDGVSEGYWSSRLSIEFGREWGEDKKWLIVDRESVLGFDSPDIKENGLVRHTGDKADFMDEIDRAVIYTKEKLAETHRWAAKQSKPFGNELDFLAIDEDKQLLSIELKIAKNGDGIAWGPLQAAVYQKSFCKAIEVAPEIAKNIEKMVRQKVQLGILPDDALSMIPPGGFKSVSSVLAVTDGSKPVSDEYWKRARIVNANLVPQLSNSSIVTIADTAKGLDLTDVTTPL
ncbi:MAG: hypothetical protein LWW87_01855 [Geobacteraceae bacterium]|nr:hypothetical protein [Geobacteraceae bacterium]